MKDFSHNNKDKHKDKNLYYDDHPELARAGAGNDVLQFVIHFQHLGVSIVHVHLKGVKHFVLLVYLNTEVLVFKFYIGNYSTEDIQMLILA
tara:strand:+ start:57 stop:329 length:273 start_codon:yes stop_codon:yes gene_type:complete